MKVINTYIVSHEGQIVPLYEMEGFWLIQVPPVALIGGNGIYSIPDEEAKKLIAEMEAQPR